MEDFSQKRSYCFKILWSKTYIGIAVNQQNEKDLDIPLTSFYFWPREDGWKLLQAELESKPWMNETSKSEILNSYSKIIDFWLDNVHKPISQKNIKNSNLNLSIDLLGINSIR